MFFDENGLYGPIRRFGVRCATFIVRCLSRGLQGFLRALSDGISIDGPHLPSRGTIKSIITADAFFYSLGSLHNDTGTNESAKVGDTLIAIVTGADVVTYSWTADGTEVGTEATLDITSDMLGKKIQVKVTALDGETVKSEESAPVEYEKPELVTAVRKAANSFTATFDADAQDIVTADEIEVISEDLTDVKKITGLDFSLDGT